MYNDLQFKVSAELKNIIGKDLITDDFSAVFELVKNSFDAHASIVKIKFLNIKSGDGLIVIEDNGKGMSYDDIINKWLFVAYSAKRDGTEDIDYRHKIQKRKYFAGAKGIGRFSCDKLGKKLRLLSKKDEEKSKLEEVLIDWELFEKNSQDNFIDVNVRHRTLEINELNYDSGTSVEISQLRSDPKWGREKILKLKNDLAKLINPFDSKSQRDFRIEISAPEFKEEDNLYTKSSDRVNGVVENEILNIIRLKTTRIKGEISRDGKNVLIELSDDGKWIYRIKEKNTSFPLLKDILIEVFFLNRKSKLNFTKMMGLRSRDYGSIFLYKNGIRIYPFGEPSDDGFALDARKLKRVGNYVGTNDLIGRIEIIGENRDFIEASSRGNGLIKNSSYNELKDFFIEKIIVKIESFRKHVIKYGVNLDNISGPDGDGLENIVRLISDVSDGDNIIDIDFNENLLSLLQNVQEDSNSAQVVIKNIENIARETNNDFLFSEISKVKRKIKDAVKDVEISDRELYKARKEVKEKETQNLFLKSLKSHDSDELVSLMHHIGISSGIVNNSIRLLTYKIDKNIKIDESELNRILSNINFENQKILSISRFATKTNFKVNAENQRLDLVQFIREYINNVASNFLNNLKVEFHRVGDNGFVSSFRPLEMTILLDNLLSNSRKAKATKVAIILNTTNDKKLVLTFRDNGNGIPEKNRNRVFDFGFTTSSGSGLGLHHIKEILNRIKADIELNEKYDDGAEFIINFKK